MRLSVPLAVALAALVAVNLGLARPPKSGPAVPPRVSTTTQRSAPGAATDHRASGGARHPYWRLERKYVAQQHRMGRLGAELRRLRLEKRSWTAQRRLQAVPDRSTYAIRLAASAYGVPESEMRTVASCETGGTFSATAYNASSGASGLFQFLGSTWASQGLAGFSVYDPVANALAAARIVSREGWAQWSCQPR